MAAINKDNGTAIKSSVKPNATKEKSVKSTTKPTPITAAPSANAAPKLPSLNGIRPEIAIERDGITYTVATIATLIETLKTEQTNRDNAKKAADAIRKSREEARTKRQIAEVKQRRDARVKELLAQADAEMQAELKRLGVSVKSPKGKAATSTPPANVEGMTPAQAAAAATAAGIAVANITAAEDAAEKSA